MKKTLFKTLSVSLFFALVSFYLSLDEDITPEKFCGIWEGTFIDRLQGNPRPRYYKSKLIITQQLKGIFGYSVMDSTFIRILDGPGEIVNNQLLLREKTRTDSAEIKVNLTEGNMIEGEGVSLSLYKGKLTKFKKIRSLTNSEKRLSVEALEILVESPQRNWVLNVSCW
jgi:hypothetical protein